ncbi:dTDP-4-dehydrorhamnose 3,5-epimerase, partial [Ruminobacter amylophilus]
IPEGFAHGFYVMSETAEFVYKCTNYYDPTSEHSILWNDPDIGIKWPLADGIKINLSDKDTKASALKDAVLFE